MQHVPAEPELVHHAGPVVLDDDVALGGQVLGELQSRGCFEVDDDAFLAAVDRKEVVALAVAHRREAASFVADTRRLDLDYLGAQIGQRQARGGPRQHPGEIEHAHAGKRASIRRG